MPRGDRTGPAGFGPMTGRRAGYCAGYTVPGYMNPWPYGGFGRGRGYGAGWWGGGRRWRNRFNAPGYPVPPMPYPYPYAGEMVPDEEREFLKQEAEELRSEFRNIEKRLSEMEEKDSE
ncbi:MAG TPA: hypothetical protein DCG87_02355 [Synergistaceae bacterium]|nr:hypothetical protein [Synergistales bacterium]HAG22126.1 hypothetical protein [Synergistaceae bacterium]